jgi:hypothetical protein
MEPPPQQSPPQGSNGELEWLDELGFVCPKSVDYGTQCPKGHFLVAFPTGEGKALSHCRTMRQCLICRICHAHTEPEHASRWLVCSMTGCCSTYAVCHCCASELKQPRSARIGDEFSSLVRTFDLLRMLRMQLLSITRLFLRSL